MSYVSFKSLPRLEKSNGHFKERDRGGPGELVQPSEAFFLCFPERPLLFSIKRTTLKLGYDVDTHVAHLWQKQLSKIPTTFFFNNFFPKCRAGEAVSHGFLTDY